MKITHSELASEQRKTLLKQFPGLERHFSELEKAVKANPDNGTKEIILSKTGYGIPVRTMSAETEIFGGVASYSKELTIETRPTRTAHLLLRRQLLYPDELVSLTSVFIT